MEILDSYRARLLKVPRLVWLFKWARCRSKFAFNKTRKRGRNNIIMRDWAITNGLKIQISGDNNKVIIRNSAIINQSTIRITGNNNIIEIGNSCAIDRTEFCIEDSRCQISLGSKTTIGGAHLAATEDESSIQIGSDCMFARGIEIRTGDSHAIFDSLGNRLNRAQSISIGDHVWVGMYSTILKGAKIGDGTVVATRSLVTKGTYEQSSILAGTPAKVVRTNVVWTRSRVNSVAIDRYGSR